MELDDYTWNCFKAYQHVIDLFVNECPIKPLIIDTLMQRLYDGDIFKEIRKWS